MYSRKNIVLTSHSKFGNMALSSAATLTEFSPSSVTQVAILATQQLADALEMLT